MAWLYKQPGSENWWIGYRLNGQQFRRSTGTPDEAQAERELAKLRSIHEAHKAGSLTEEFFRLLTKQESNNVTLKKAVTDWLHDCRSLDGDTLERYRNVSDGLCEYLKADDAAPLLRDVQRNVISDFLRFKRNQTSDGTTKLYRRVLAGFFNHAVENELLRASPVPSSKSLKLIKTESETKRRAFTLEELRTIYGLAKTAFWRYMIVMGFYCGQRMGDLICLPWGGVDFDQNIITLHASKQNRAVKIPMRSDVRNMLLELKTTAGGDVKPNQYIWPDQAQRYQKQGAGTFSNEFYDDILLPAGLVPPRTHKAKKDRKSLRRNANAVSFHCLRHTFVSLLKVSGGSQAVAKELAGHSSDAVSDLYTHVPEDALRKALKKLPEVI